LIVVTRTLLLFARLKLAALRIHHSARHHTTMTRFFAYSRRLLALIGLPLLLSACALGPPPGVTPVTNFALERYLGTWYEIARLDHSFERAMSDVSARYSKNTDGSVRVLNRGFDNGKDNWRDAEGRALFIGEPTTGSLKVSFFGPFYGGYHVADLDPDYRWVLVIGPDPSYAWILARDKTITAEVRERLLATAKRGGIDTTKLIWVTHERKDPALNPSPY
jgi:apolipoprotein D and lipocalin family protein